MAATGAPASQSAAEPDERTLRYGYRKWTPKCLQRLNNPKAFLGFMCWFVLVQSFPVNGLLNVNTTTLQRRFKLTSTHLGLLSAVYDIVGGIVVVPISYFGGRGHKGHYLAIGSLFMVVGSFVMAAPHVFVGAYSYSTSGYSGSKCSVMQKQPACGAYDLSTQNYLYVFLLGQGLMGYGGLVLYTLCPVFLEDNVNRRDSPMYMGVFYATAALAAAIGFLAGSQFLNVFVDAPAATPTVLTQDDPEWVGAWWLGYVINACLAAPLAFFIFGYPRELPGAAKVKQDRVCEAHQTSPSSFSSTAAADDATAEAANLADLPAATAILCKNPAFVCLTVSGICDSLFKSGVSQFLAAYIENQFNQTSAWAALLSGFALVPGAVGGSIVGGWLPRKYNMRVRGLISLCVCSSVIILLLSAGFLMNCKAPLAADGGTFNLTRDCNAHCGCGTASYKPVCGSDGLQYFSACHAGCDVSTMTNESSAAFSDCRCVVGNVTLPRTAREGMCEVDCPLLHVFMVLIFLGIFASFVKLSPWTAATMRVVKADKRAYALGLQAVFVRLLGIAPGPVVFGAIIDSTCSVWQEQCAAKGSCWIYRSDDLSHSIVTCLASLKLASLIFDVLALQLYRSPRIEAVHLEATSAADEAPATLSEVNYDDRGLAGDSAYAVHGDGKLEATANGFVYSKLS